GRATGPPDVPPGPGARPRGDREHELPRLPWLRSARRRFRARRGGRDGARARRAGPRRDPPRARGAGGRGSRTAPPPPPARRRPPAGPPPEPPAGPGPGAAGPTPP